MSIMAEPLAAIQRKYIQNLLRKGRRIDNRGLNEYRQLKITPGFAGNAEGSAMIELGKTKVLAGVKLELGEPFKDTPDRGVLITNAELVPLASPEFEPGPPDENAIELARVVDRGIRESEALRLDELVIKEGEVVWVVFIDAHILDHSGNLFDATMYGAVTALLTAKMPRAVIEEGEIKTTEELTSLPMEKIPVSVTIGKIGENLIVDPNLQEENVLDAEITIIMENKDTICAVQKIFGVFSPEEVGNAISIAREKSAEIRELIKETVSGYEA